MDFLISLWKRNAVRLVVVSFCVIIGLKYMIPFLGPFLPALLFVVLLNPILTKLHKKIKISKGVLAGGVLLLLTIVLTAVLSLLGTMIVNYLTHTWEVYRDYSAQLLAFFQTALGTMEDKMGLKDGVLEEGIIHEFTVLWQQLRLALGREAMGISYSYLEKGAEILLYITFLVIGILLLAKDYDTICEKLFEWDFFHTFTRVLRRLLRMMGIYCKAQGIVLVCISAISVCGLWVLGIRNPWFWGILAGILDVLPFIGAGMVLVPLGIFAAVFGNFWALPGSILLFGIATFIRHLLEPKLIGQEIDIYPIALLFSVFLGIGFYQLGGIVLGPVALFLIKEIYGEIRCK